MDLGPVIESVEIRITGEDGVTPLPENVIGRLQIRGLVVTPGYVNRPAANLEAFVADGWFDSGDLGFLRNGRLHLTGRRQETINIRGANLYCYEVERQVTSVPGVLASYVAATSVFNDAKGTEDLLVFFSPDGALANTACLSSTDGLDKQMLHLIKDVQKTVTRSTGIAPAHCIPVLASNFHKTTSGKIQRSKFRSMFLEGHYDDFLSRIDVVPEILQSNCFKHVWDLVEKVRIETAVGPNMRVQLDRACRNTSLTQKLEHVLCGAGGSLVHENADHILCLAALESVPASASEVASITVRVIERINATFRSTEGKSRFWVVTSSKSGLENVLTSAVHGWMRSLAMERPERKPSMLMMDFSVAALQNIPRVLAESRFDAASEIFLREDEILIASLRKERVPLAGTLRLSSDAAYLITGGTGALGLELAKFLVNMGARNLVLFSRKGELDLHTKTLEPLRGKGAHIRAFSGDVSVQSDVETLLKLLLNKAEPLKGVFHLAGVYERCATRDCTTDFLEHVFRAKAKGAALLHECIDKAPIDLDHFVLFSSVAVTVGPVGYAAYAAANAFLDGLASMRRQRGYPALSLRWGPWDHSKGMAGDVEFEFLKKIELKEGMASLGLLMKAAAPTGLVLSEFSFSSYRMNSDEDESFIVPHLLEKLVGGIENVQAEDTRPTKTVSAEILGDLIGEILGFIPKPDEELLSIGLDSTGIMRFIGSLKKTLQVGLPLNFVFKYPTLRAIANYFHGERPARGRDCSTQAGTTRPIKESSEFPPSTSAPQATSSMSPHKLRCLVLHGEASSAELIRVQMQSTGWVDGLESAVEFIYVDAPHPCHANTSLHNTLVRSGMYEAKKTYFGWGLEPCKTYVSPGSPEKSSSEMLYDSIKYIQYVLHKHAPIDSIAGICDGALLASCVVALSPKEATRPLSFLLNFCSPPLSRLPSELVGELSIIKCLNIHFLGLQDELYSQEDLLSIPRFSKNAVVCYHDGGHVIPVLDTARRALVVVSIEEILKRNASNKDADGIRSSQDAVVVIEPDTSPQFDSEIADVALNRTRVLLHDSNISLDTSLLAVGMTSLQAVDFALMLSELFQKEVSPNVVLTHSTLRKILSSLSALSGTSSAPPQVATASLLTTPQTIDSNFCSVHQSMMKWLDFDTQVLGIPTSRALNVSTPKDLERVLEHAKSEGVHLLCMSLNEGHPLEVVAEPHRVCTKVTYTNSTSAMIKVLQKVACNKDAALSVKEFVSEDTISSELIELAVNTGTHSRFQKDPRLGREKLINMYETWLRNSANRVAADYMVVATVCERHGEKVVGYITCTIKECEGHTFGDISLMACSQEYKNLRVNWHLLHSAVEWFDSKGIDRVESSTHETNRACRAMFEIVGMQVSGKSHDYHIWVQPGQVKTDLDSFEEA